MENEKYEEYMKNVGGSQQGLRNTYPVDVVPDNPPGPLSESEDILSLTETIHDLIDNIEQRLFGRPPQAVSATKGDQVIPTRPLATVVTHARQRADTATDRLRKLYQRL